MDIMKKKVFANRPVLLGFGTLGNGCTVWDKNVEHEVTKDYIEVCHITDQGKIKWNPKYDRKLSKAQEKMIADKAEKMRVDYLRYTNDRESFIRECFEQAERHEGVVMTVGWAKNIWQGLQAMPDPENFKFDMIR